MTRLFTGLLATLMLAFSSSVPAAVGFQFKERAFHNGERQLNVALWYPAAPDKACNTVADNAIFIGHCLEIETPPTPGQHPLVVLSHGYGGSWRNQSWLAARLAAQGYWVMATDHPGTTVDQLDEPTTAQLWERPRDISALLDVVNAEEAFSPFIDKDRIVVIGHSLGGWTAMELAGALFSHTLMIEACKQHPKNNACADYKQLHAGQNAQARDALSQPLRDPRVKAAVTLDLDLTGGFDRDSLKQVHIPVLVVAGTAAHNVLDPTLESTPMADALPTDRVQRLMLPQADHFTFFQLCKPKAIAILNQISPDDRMICYQGGRAQRGILHTQISEHILKFLASTFYPPKV